MTAAIGGTEPFSPDWSWLLTAELKQSASVSTFAIGPDPKAPGVRGTAPIAISHQALMVKCYQALIAESYQAVTLRSWEPSTWCLPTAVRQFSFSSVFRRMASSQGLAGAGGGAGDLLVAVVRQAQAAGPDVPHGGPPQHPHHLRRAAAVVAHRQHVGHPRRERPQAPCRAPPHEETSAAG